MSVGIEKMKKKIVIDKGETHGFFRFSVFNTILYSLWALIYIICLFARANAFTAAQAEMAVLGYAAYTVEVTSPMFGILEFIAMLLPLILAIWILVLFLNDRKGKRLCTKKIIVAAFSVDVIASLLCAMDIINLHMVFT